jgi:hypothetical protein
MTKLSIPPQFVAKLYTTIKKDMLKRFNKKIVASTIAK